MPKKLKLNLNDLKIQSFVTALNEEERLKMQGGTGDDCATPSNCAETQCTCVTYCDTCGTGCNTCRPSICSGWVCC